MSAQFNFPFILSFLFTFLSNDSAYSHSRFVCFFVVLSIVACSLSHVAAGRNLDEIFSFSRMRTSKGANVLTRGAVNSLRGWTWAWKSFPLNNPCLISVTGSALTKISSREERKKIVRKFHLFAFVEESLEDGVWVGKIVFCVNFSLPQ